MISIINANGQNEKDIVKRLKSRAEKTSSFVVASVTEIIDAVKSRGDNALLEYTEKFDKVSLKSLEYPIEKAREALELCDKGFVEALKNAANNIEDFHRRQIQQSWLNAEKEGIIVGQVVRPLQRVGIYVPGGTAAYPSSVLMNAIPAKIAGVKEIIMVTPPTKQGTIDENILAAAAIAGVDRIFTVGGAQAVAALSFGTKSIPKVDKIVGPGNIYVATAKRLLFGEVDIDMIAGPSEILIIADDNASSEYIAADLMSQAEHDVLASSILVTTSQKVAEGTLRELERQIERMPRKDIIRQSLMDFGAIIVCENLDNAFNIANDLAPEHLEIMTENPMQYLCKVENAGSIFLGYFSPESLGDYYAGPNHVLPTGGTARFFSPLSVESFVKKSGVIYYSREALEDAREDIVKIAQAEGLEAHANSVKVRF